MLRTIIVVVGTAIYCTIEGAIFLPLGLLFRKPEWVYRAGWRVARAIVWLSGVRVEVQNGENLYPGRACVFVCNHVSNLDPPAIATILPRVVVMAKRQVFSIPIMGAAFRQASFIPVDRGTERAANAVKVGTERLRQGFSILAYPEGTRSTTGELLPFRHGVFLMAIRAGAPIVPMTVTGAREIMRKGNHAIHPGVMKFYVHPAISTEGLAESDRGALAERTREIIGSVLPPPIP